MAGESKLQSTSHGIPAATGPNGAIKWERLGRGLRTRVRFEKLQERVQDGET